MYESHENPETYMLHKVVFSRIGNYTDSQILSFINSNHSGDWPQSWRLAGLCPHKEFIL